MCPRFLTGSNNTAQRILRISYRSIINSLSAYFDALAFYKLRETPTGVERANNSKIYIVDWIRGWIHCERSIAIGRRAAESQFPIASPDLSPWRVHYGRKRDDIAESSRAEIDNSVGSRNESSKRVNRHCLEIVSSGFPRFSRSGFVEKTSLAREGARDCSPRWRRTSRLCKLRGSGGEESGVSVGGASVPWTILEKGHLILSGKWA